MNREEIEKLIDKSKVAFISSIDNEGYPNNKAMLEPRERIGLREFYFSTNTSSMRVKQYLNNSKSCIYFYDKGKFSYRGIMFRGNMEVVTDSNIKKKYWKASDVMFYKKGVTDPDYCILKFTSIDGRWYKDLKTENMEVV